METDRTCTKCQITQPINEYRIIKKGNPRRETQCISCRKDYSKQYRKDNRKLQNAQHQVWRFKKTIKELKATIKELQDGV